MAQKSCESVVDTEDPRFYPWYLQVELEKTLVKYSGRPPSTSIHKTEVDGPVT